jgi:diguanylate cyclase (GGDEF)-like protein
MKQRLQPNPLTDQVTLSVLALALLAMALIGGFGLFATLHADREALRRQKAFVANGLAEQVEAIAREQESVTVWDDAIMYVKANEDIWIRENLSEWMHSYYGHDRVYILDERGEPVHAMVGGAAVPAERYFDVKDILAPPVAKLRHLITGAATSDDPPKLAIGDLVSIDGRPAILSIMPIIPSSDRLTQEPGAEYVHISVQQIDAELIGRIAEQYQLAGARLLPLLSEQADAAIPLVDSRGAILGFIGWEQERPGLTFIRKTAPALLAGLLLAAGVLWFLLRRLRRASAQLQRSRTEADFIAFHDALTTLPNRALFEDRLKRAYINVERTSARIALLYIDLDRFKHVNDTFGHPAGDELVRQTAARLKASIRPVDTVARLGGDEFAVLLTGIRDLRSAEDLCEQLLAEIARPFELMGDLVHVGASIGVALGPDPGTGPDELLRKADIALYEAKKKGRGRYEVFAGDMDDLLSRRRLIETELRTALREGGQLRLAYQPIFAADCRTILGAEALIRWDHPVHGAMSPSQFITIAEERGIIGELGEWLLGSACRFASATSLPWVAINVSPLQLRDERFAERLLAIAAEAGLGPHRLQIEITEGILLDHDEQTTTMLSHLRKTGIRVALDDFGTGYSSINYLRRYGIDKLKVDRSFVQMLGSPDGSEPIVKAIIDLAKALKVAITVEGVETARQRDIVLALGCDELQGYLLAPPLDETKLLRLLEETDYPPARQLILANSA